MRCLIYLQDVMGLFAAPLDDVIKVVPAIVHLVSHTYLIHDFACLVVSNGLNLYF